VNFFAVPFSCSKVPNVFSLTFKNNIPFFTNILITKQHGTHNAQTHIAPLIYLGSRGLIIDSCSNESFVQSAGGWKREGGIVVSNNETYVLAGGRDSKVVV